MDAEKMAASMKQLSQDVVLLVRNELELAREEMVGKAKSAGAGVGMLSGSAVTGLLTLGTLTALLILVLSLAVAPWIAALIVTLLWGGVTAVLALSGKKKIQAAGSLLPEQTIENVKEDIAWAKSGMKDDVRSR
ncbi:MAG TPA: phage holin family protein [Candidatus Rubrimentiphilum sp.]|nr:phage holin family protein [Candidatus Rubrimentiphilum sp.]